MRLVMATSLWARLTGLLRKTCCSQGETLLLAPCKSIHSFGMRCSLDVAFIDAQARVLLSERNVPAGQMRSQAQAVAVLERRSCLTEEWFAEGDHLTLQGNSITKKEDERS